MPRQPPAKTINPMKKGREKLLKSIGSPISLLLIGILTGFILAIKG